jgi:hypothetical protein
MKTNFAFLSQNYLWQVLKPGFFQLLFLYRIIDHNQHQKNLKLLNPQVVLQTDASILGWGAVMNDSKTGSRWNYDEKENHINYLELLAVFYALKAFQ